jgi:hypothetical protein
MLGRKWENSESGASYTPKTQAPANTTPAVKKSVPKQEEEISIEDIPF